MSDLHFEAMNLPEAVEALRRDLIAKDGPRISTMRNYQFAILAYRPEWEFDLRRRVRQLTDELQREGWNVLSISLHKLFLDRIRANPALLASTARQEKRAIAAGDRDRAIGIVKDRYAALVEGDDGIVADVIRQIHDFAEKYPDNADRTLILIGRAGALYPFSRSSPLLRHLDGQTRNLPVVLLYPGERKDVTALSFMGEMPADRDYRPRIYS